LGLVAEYDALPHLGHACGHNLIAAGAVGAALALAGLGSSVPGELVLFGTPAEEGGGGKVVMAEAGLFDDLDAVIYFHPSVRDDLYGSTLACQIYRVTFLGREAHVQLNPDEGRNALMALVHALYSLQQEHKGFPQLSRIGAVVNEGGDNPILVPGRARGEFLLSAKDDQACEAIERVFHGVVRRAAKETQTRVEMEKTMHYPSVRLNPALTQIIADQMQSFGLSPAEPSLLVVSTDCGATSLRCPFGGFRLHLGQPAPYPHTPEFAELCGGPEGEKIAFLAAQIQALTLMELFFDRDLLQTARREFEAVVGKPLNFET
jgi:amidohydrolase